MFAQISNSEQTPASALYNNKHKKNKPPGPLHRRQQEVNQIIIGVRDFSLTHTEGSHTQLQGVSRTQVSEVESSRDSYQYKQKTKAIPLVFVNEHSSGISTR